jgi:tRNA-guanine family transglycosylase
MGLGDAEGVLDAVQRGADLFDCVWPTRLARHGKVLTRDGDFNIRRAENTERHDQRTRSGTIPSSLTAGARRVPPTAEAICGTWL